MNGIDDSGSWGRVIENKKTTTHSSNEPFTPRVLPLSLLSITPLKRDSQRERENENREIERVRRYISNENKERKIKK